MAYIVNGVPIITKSAASALARVDFDRQHDAYRLAKLGNREAQRMWNDFAREDPDSARLVVTYDARLTADKGDARKDVDAMLTKGGKFPGRSGKQSRKQQKAQLAAQPPPPQPPIPTLRDMLDRDRRTDPDPRVRATAERAVKELDAAAERALGAL